MLSGDPLPTIAKGLRQLRQLSHDYNQQTMVRMVGFVYQLSVTLMGKADVLTKLTGEFVDEDVHLQEARNENRTMILTAHAYFKHLVAFYCDQYDSAESMSRANRTKFSSTRNPIPIFTIVQAFHEGLVATSMAWRNKRQLRVARKRLKTLESSIIHCPENVMHKVYLLSAEILEAENRHDDAMCKYMFAIKYAKKAGFVNEEGLANEKTGRVLLRRNKPAQAIPYLKEARELYGRWGAGMKVAAMEELIAELPINGHDSK